MEEEIWKDIPGWEGIYQVSNFGGIKSFKVNKKGCVMKHTNKTGWYLTFNLKLKGRVTVTKRIHRLVAELFIPNPYKYNMVNHKDMNKQNNCVENLEWVTCSQNVKHAVKNKPNMVAAMNHYNRFIRPYPIIQRSLSGEYINTYPNCTEASLATGVCSRNICQVAYKEEYRHGLTRKQAGGYRWELVR